GSCLADVGSSFAYYIKMKGNHDGTSGPELIVEAVDSPGILPPPEEIRTTSKGDEDFCADNPGHKSCCTGEDCDDDGDVCEQTGSVILSGTKTLSGGVTRCELVKKDYWLEN
ncbi:MAG: hypothetical protein V7765_22095, partial [Oleispira sp.]